MKNRTTNAVLSLANAIVRSLFRELSDGHVAERANKLLDGLDDLMRAAGLG